uniref:LysM domain-containing protein n=1 Tax=Tetradesmus obliquus TaxID=3088 RepID=A0A383WA42_TETOB|eukprot:jgi/Sobl393_1/6710/SZX74505.1
MAAPEGDLLSKAPQPVQNFVRSTEFFGRVAVIYGAYKATQLKAAVMRLQGSSAEPRVKALWDSQHTWAGEQMYDLAISLRGFYLKAGQFIGARADFVPEQICAKLCLLQDKVPPMAPERATQVLCQELGISDVGEVFEWIDMDTPIGSASISQVHKAQLRRFPRSQLRSLARQERGLMACLTVGPGDSAWSICNSHGISLAELAAANKQVEIDDLQPGQVLKVPVVLGLEHFQHSSSSSSSNGSGSGPLQALSRMLSGNSRLTQQHSSSGGGGGSGSVHSSFSSDRAGSINSTGGLSESECSSSSSSEDWLEPGSSLFAAGQQLGKKANLFGLLTSSSSSSSQANALLIGRSGSSSDATSSSTSRSSSSGQIGLPDVHSPAAAAVAHAAASGSVPDGGLVAVKIQYPGALQTMSIDLVNLRATSAFLQKTELKFDLLSAVEELQKQIHLEFDFMSVPGLVSRRLMVMSFMEGLPLLQLKDKVAHLPQWKREKAARRILARVSEAYGLMILGEGLFQADGHPGNILVQGGGRVALLDYGQSKQLGEEDKRAFADLVLAMSKGDKPAISAALSRLNVSTSKDDVGLRSEMAYGMFDTRGKVDPFDKNSPIKQAAVEHFPPDMFFVLRVVQLLRGMANGMGIDDFSTADQWAPLARQAIQKAERKDSKRRRQQQVQQRLQAQPVYDLAAIAAPLQLTV